MNSLNLVKITSAIAALTLAELVLPNVAYRSLPAAAAERPCTNICSANRLRRPVTHKGEKHRVKPSSAHNKRVPSSVVYLDDDPWDLRPFDADYFWDWFNRGR